MRGTIFFFRSFLPARFYGEVRPKASSVRRTLLQEQDAIEEAAAVKEDYRLILFTHYTFLVSVNGPKVIEISWEGGDENSNMVITDVDENLSVGFTYTIQWKDVETEYGARAQK